MASPKRSSRKSLRTLRSMLVGQRQCLPLPWQNTFLARKEWLLVHDVKWKRVSNIQPNLLALNVRRHGQEPSLFVRSFSAITRLEGSFCGKTICGSYTYRFSRPKDEDS